MANPRLDELCEKLFNKYQEVFDYLIDWNEKNKTQPYKFLLDLLENELNKKYQKTEWKYERGKDWISLFNSMFRTRKTCVSIFFSHGIETESLRKKIKENFLTLALKSKLIQELWVIGNASLSSHSELMHL